jgi:hypothetical protein
MLGRVLCEMSELRIKIAGQFRSGNIFIVSQIASTSEKTRG